MTDNHIIERAIDEIKSKTFGTTQQLLEIHEVVHVNKRPQALRVNRKNDGTAIVYFPIKDEKFYLAVWLEPIPEVTVTGVGTENYNAVYLKATSEDLTLDELAALTTLPRTDGWSKGDLRKSGNLKYSFSALLFEPNPEPEAFEDKLRKLLDFIEQDTNGIRRLGENASLQIQVATVFHNGNTMLGGQHLDKDILKRIADLNLEINFDLYAEGNFYKE